MSVDVLADLSLRTPAFVVEDGDGEPIARRVAFPPLGARMVVAARGRTNSASFGVGFYAATGAWDTSLVWAPTTWTLHADLGWRHSFAGEDDVGWYMDVGGGVRVVVLSQPWWDDYAGFGAGEHVAVGYTLPGSWVVDARIESTLTFSGVHGDLDSALGDVSWDWLAAGIRVGVGVGRTFR